jgi:tryptophan halogenase
MIGLSSMFVEPLEASSIGTTIQQTFALLPSIYNYDRNEEKTPAMYNTMITNVATNIVDFIQLHYFTQRKDTEFWRWCTNNIKLTDFNKENLDYFKKQGVNPQYFNTPMILFGHMNYMQIMHSLRMFDTDYQNARYQKHMSEKYDPITKSILDEDRRYMTDVPQFSHRQALEIIKERGRSKNEIKYKF